MRIRLVTLLTALLALAFAIPVSAANLLINGDFETTSFNYTDGSGTHYPGTAFENFFDGQVVEGWTSGGYNFVFTPDMAASASGSPSSPSYLSLWGMPGTGVSNGIGPSPTGGNFVVSDGAYQNGPLSQTVSGLEVGHEYAVSFWWAAGQQFGFDGATTDAWTVCFGTCAYTSSYDSNGDGYSTFTPGSDQIMSTGAVAVPNHGFVPWRYETVNFTATSSTQTLSLLAYGTPLGQPPFALIDGLQLEAVPEPTTWAMMLIGFGLVGGAMRTRRRSFSGRRALNAQII